MLADGYNKSSRWCWQEDNCCHASQQLHACLLSTYGLQMPMEEDVTGVACTLPLSWMTECNCSA